jgi:hypothetical protein
MPKVVFSNKRILLSFCIVILGVLISTTYFLVSQNKLANNNKIYSNSDSFNFSLNFNTYGKDQINTYNGTFTKDLVLDGTKTINFTLPDEIKQEIYKLMVNADIMSFPDSLKVNGMFVTPSCDYKLKVTIGGKTKTIEWKEGFYPSIMTEGLPKENAEFLNIVKYISDYIYDTKEYKRMPKPNGGYD